MGHGFFPAHAALKRFEKTGSSRLFSLYAPPAFCGTVFLPGCALAGTRPDKTMKLFELLRQSEPSIGMVLDCCTKPSHDLGRESYFHAMFNKMRDYLLTRGIKKGDRRLSELPENFPAVRRRAEVETENNSKGSSSKGGERELTRIMTSSGREGHVKTY